MDRFKAIEIALKVVRDASGAPNGPPGNSATAKKIRKKIKGFLDGTDEFAVFFVGGLKIGIFYVFPDIGYTADVRREIERRIAELAEGRVVTAPDAEATIATLAEAIFDAEIPKEEEPAAGGRR